MAFIYGAEPFYHQFEKFALRLLSKIADKFQLTGNSIQNELVKSTNDPIQMQFKSLIFDALCEFQHPAVIQYSKEVFEAHYDNVINGQKEKSLVFPDVRQAVYSTVVAAGG